MKIKIDRELKIKLLKALKDGYIETQELPELQEMTATFHIHPIQKEGILSEFANDESQVII